MTPATGQVRKKQGKGRETENYECCERGVWWSRRVCEGGGGVGRGGGDEDD